MLKRSLLGAVALFALVALPTPGRAGVSIDLGIHLPGPPVLVPVPASPVTYAPDAPANYFAYGGSYYVFAGDAWYVSSGYDGPWVVVAPEFVPRPLLVVPVRYYHAPPPAWGRWRREAAPRWEPRWGRSWHGRGAVRVERHDPRMAHNHGEHDHGGQRHGERHGEPRHRD